MTPPLRSLTPGHGAAQQMDIACNEFAACNDNTTASWQALCLRVRKCAETFACASCYTSTDLSAPNGCNSIRAIAAIRPQPRRVPKSKATRAQTCEGRKRSGCHLCRDTAVGGLALLPTLHVYSMVVREQQRNPHRGQLAFGNSKSLGIGTRVAQLRCGGGGWRCLQCARVSGPALSLPVSGRPPLWRARGQSATMQDCVPFQGRKKPSCARSQVHYAAVRGLGGQQPAEERARA